jgi:cell wall-associated NlpC family hydrolase
MYSPAQAVARCLALVGKGEYRLGALDSDAERGVFDCTSFCMRYAYGLPGHIPGYNTGWGQDWMTGATSTVVDDLNSNSAVEDAMHAAALFQLVIGPPLVGDIIAAPTVYLAGHKPWIGHGVIVVGTERARGHWDPQRPTFAALDVVECHGPDGCSPAIRRTTGAWFDERGQTWPKVQHRPWLLRVRAA